MSKRVWLYEEEPGVGKSTPGFFSLIDEDGKPLLSIIYYSAEQARKSPKLRNFTRQFALDQVHEYLAEPDNNVRLIRR